MYGNIFTRINKWCTCIVCIVMYNRNTLHSVLKLCKCILYILAIYKIQHTKSKKKSVPMYIHIHTTTVVHKRLKQMYWIIHFQVGFKSTRVSTVPHCKCILCLHLISVWGRYSLDTHKALLQPAVLQSSEVDCANFTVFTPLCLFVSFQSIFHKQLERQKSNTTCFCSHEVEML